MGIGEENQDLNNGGREEYKVVGNIKNPWKKGLYQNFNMVSCYIVLLILK